MVSVELERYEDKKNSVRYNADGTTKNPALTSAYISNTAVEVLGNPERVRVTIEAL